MIRNFWIAVVCTMFLPSMVFGGYYTWKDSEGNIHFTDNYYAVPQEHRTSLNQSNYGNRKGDETLSQKTPQRVVVHFQRKDNVIFVNATLNWQHPVVFHLDTGATNTMITRDDALALGIDPDTRPGMKGYIADGSVVEFPTAVLSSIAVGEAEVNNINVAIGSVRLLGMNFLNEFQVKIDSNNGQLILERKNAVQKNTVANEPESEYIREEKNRTATEMENQIEQLEIAIEAREKIIKQIEQDIRLTEEKKSKVESALRGAQQSTRFEGSDVSFDVGKNKRMERYEEILLNLERHISIRNDEIALYLKQIDQLNDRMDHYDQMIMKLR
jgi:clan AA aspartic protease (TIGR02281 family)